MIQITMFAMLNMFGLDSWLQFTMHTNILFSRKTSYLYLYVEKSSQMTHFSCNIPYTAQVYSGKPREGQYFQAPQHKGRKNKSVYSLFFMTELSGKLGPVV